MRLVANGSPVGPTTCRWWPRRGWYFLRRPVLPAPRLGRKRVAYQPSSWLRPPPCVGPGHKHTEGRGEPVCAGPTGDGQPRARAHQLQRFSHCATGAPRELGSPTRQIWRRCFQPSPVPMLLKGRFAKLPVTRWPYCERSAAAHFRLLGPSNGWTGHAVKSSGSVVRSGWRAQWCCVAGGIRGRGRGWYRRTMGRARA